MNLVKNIQKIATEVLLNEALAIQKIAQFIDIGFEHCVENILQLKGRVVVTGVGKSAIVAQKIVATLNSTGTPALFMHAADAIHGDLGMVQRDDMVICLSKSGNTPEIKVLVPLLKRTGCQLAGMVSNMDSFLAKQVDFILNAHIDSEACPNNLAPTTSTTVQMALGDALAICLLEARGFSSDDFAQYHPGGSLGKQLYLKVDDILLNHEIPKVNASAGIREIIIEISSKRLGATAVVDDNDCLIGVITDGDLRRMLEKNENFNSLRATEVMSQNPKTMLKGSFALKALNLMQQNNIAQVLIVDEHNQVAGFVHLHDLLKEGIV